MSGAVAPTVSAEDYGDTPAGVAARWLAEVRLAEQDSHQWEQRGIRVERRYLDIRQDDNNGSQRFARRFNIFWSNVNTLKPAIYARPPKPVVQRRYLDQDPVGRAASTILQRAISTSIDESDWHETTDQAVMDYLIPGRGVCWVRYEPHLREMTSPEVQAAEAAEGQETPIEQAAEGDDGAQITDTSEPAREITYEEVCWDYVNWRDFLHSPARTWQEVRWVAREVLMTQDEGIERFGEIFREVPLTWRPEGIEAQDTMYRMFQRAIVYEIWDKPSRKVVWIAKGFGERALDERDDPLKLKDFFPCPRPLFATITSSSLLPRADYVMYQDQASLLDELQQRTASVTQAIKAVAVYNASIPELQRVFNEGLENQAIGVPQWNEFAASGGFKGAIDFLPLETFVNALQKMLEVTEATKQGLYEITGISDIIRGQGDASETATAQQLKGQYAQLRLRDRVKEVARFCRDMVRMTAEVICKHFQPQTLLLMSDYQNTTGATPEMAMQAIGLLKNDQIRGFRIDIETDSTVEADQRLEQQSRVEFLTMAGNFLREAVPLAQQFPALGPVAGQMLLFGIRGFPVGRELEGVFEMALQQLEQAAQNPPPKLPSPEEIQAQSEAQKLQLEGQKLVMEDQWKQAEFALEAEAQKLEARKIELEGEKMRHEQMMGTREQSLRGDELVFKQNEARQKADAEKLDRDISEVTAIQQAVAMLAQIMGQMHQNLAGAQQQTIEGQQQIMRAVTAPRRARMTRRDGSVAEAVSVPEMAE